MTEIDQHTHPAPVLPTGADLEERLVPPVAEALLESERGAMAPDEARDAALQVVRGRGLPEELARRLGRAPALTFVTFDADRIHGWVFSSERVPVAGGASHLLETLHDSVAELVRPVRGITGVLYSAGGGGLLVGPAVADDDARRDLEDAVRRALEARAAGLTFTVVAEAVRARDLEPAERDVLAPAEGRFAHRQGLPGVLARLQTLVRRRKEAGRELYAGEDPGERLRAPEDVPVAERCPACGQRPPAVSPVTGDEPRFWCGRCKELSRFWRQQKREALEDDRPTPTFEEFAEKGARGRGYLAFLAVDGNAMGAILQDMESLLELAAFSTATTAIYAGAREHARRLLVQRHTRDLDPELGADEASLSLLSGGDEVTLVLPACAAPEVAVAVLRSIEAGYEAACAPGALLGEVFAGRAEMLERLARAGAGAGVVCATPSYPVRLLRRYANDLQGQAKRALAMVAAGSGAEASPRSSIAFQVLTDSSPLPEGVGVQARPGELVLDRFERSLRESEAAVAVRLPQSALQRLVAAWRDEEEKLGDLDPGAGRDAVLAQLVANFFRYQLARNPALHAWWKRVGGAPPAGAGAGAEGDDGVLEWLSPNGGRRLETLVDLLAVGAPVPSEEASR